MIMLIVPLSGWGFVILGRRNGEIDGVVSQAVSQAAPSSDSAGIYYHINITAVLQGLQ